MQSIGMGTAVTIDVLGLDELRCVPGQPEVTEQGAVEREDDHWAPTHPAQLAQPPVLVLPLVHGDCGHGGVE
jgi:hypothetical protein